MRFNILSSPYTHLNISPLLNVVTYILLKLDSLSSIEHPCSYPFGLCCLLWKLQPRFLIYLNNQPLQLVVPPLQLCLSPLFLASRRLQPPFLIYLNKQPLPWVVLPLESCLPPILHMIIIELPPFPFCPSIYPILTLPHQPIHPIFLFHETLQSSPQTLHSSLHLPFTSQVLCASIQQVIPLVVELSLKPPTHSTLPSSIFNKETPPILLSLSHIMFLMSLFCGWPFFHIEYQWSTPKLHHQPHSLPSHANLIQK